MARPPGQGASSPAAAVRSFRSSLSRVRASGRTSSVGAASGGRAATGVATVCRPGLIASRGAATASCSFLATSGGAVPPAPARPLVHPALAHGGVYGRRLPRLADA